MEEPVLMNIFILNTGRCGSTTFIKACEHIRNYTAGHESRINLTGEQRLAYPDKHIEADNRLSWFLGRLDEQFGDDAFYVHLKRDTEATVNSFIRRMDFGIMKAYKRGILLDSSATADKERYARDYVDTVNSNITHFLKDKTRKMNFQLENAPHDFELFFESIGAEGDLTSSLAEWQTTYNAS